MSKSSLILLFLLCGLCSASLAQSKREIEKQIERTKKDIELTNKLLEETENSKKQTVTKLEFISKKIDLRKDFIVGLSSEISYLSQQMVKLNSSIVDLKKVIDDIKDEYARMIYYTYKNKSSYDKILFLLSSKDFNQAYKRLKYFQYYSEYRKNQVREIITKTRELNRTIISYNTTIKQKSNLISSKKVETEMLSKEQEQQSTIIISLESKQKELKLDLQEKQIIAEKLKKEIERIIAEEQRKMEEKRKADAIAAAKKAKLTNKPVEKSQDVILSGKFSDNIGKLPWPTERGVVTQTFGEHPHPLFPNIKITNNGIDISSTKGSQARCIYEGEVTKIIVIPGANTAVLVRHGNYVTVYSNLVDVVVHTGQKVTTKQNIGTIFTDTETGKTTMNLQIWKETTKLDPLKCLAK